MKTNKSYTKRLKVSKNGKIIARGSGQNHFNAKESRSQQLHKKRGRNIILNNKDKSRYLANQF
jgi:ribosomal protein L35